MHVHQAGLTRRDDLGRHGPLQQGIGREARLPLHHVLGRRMRRRVVHHQGFSRSQPVGGAGRQCVQQVILELSGQSISHANGAGLVDGDPTGIPAGQILAQVRFKPLLTVERARLEEGRQMVAQVRTDRGGLESAPRAAVVEQVGVPMPVPACDAVPAKQL